MKTTDIGAKYFPCDFHAENAFIDGNNDVILDTEPVELSELDTQKITINVD